jgi:hypothetical protein
MGDPVGVWPSWPPKGFGTMPRDVLSSFIVNLYGYTTQTALLDRIELHGLGDMIDFADSKLV